MFVDTIPVGNYFKYFILLLNFAFGKYRFYFLTYRMFIFNWWKWIFKLKTFTREYLFEFIKIIQTSTGYTHVKGHKKHFFLKILLKKKIPTPSKSNYQFKNKTWIKKELKINLSRPCNQPSLILAKLKPQDNHLCSYVLNTYSLIQTLNLKTNKRCYLY